MQVADRPPKPIIRIVNRSNIVFSHWLLLSDFWHLRLFHIDKKYKIWLDMLFH